VTVMDGKTFHGITDRHTHFAFVDRHRVLGVLPWLFSAHPNMTNANPEVALRAFYASGRMQVARMRRTAFVVATAEDSSRWRRVSRAKACAPGVFLKYLTEHFLAARACGVDPCPLKPQHRDLTELFDGNENSTKAAVAAQMSVLGRRDMGYIDGVRWSSKPILYY
jgi:hypothetical protein